MYFWLKLLYLEYKRTFASFGQNFNQKLANTPPGQNVGKHTPPKSGGLKYQCKNQWRKKGRTNEAHRFGAHSLFKSSIIPYPRANERVGILPRRTGCSPATALNERINGRNSFRTTHAWNLRQFEGNITNESTPGILPLQKHAHEINERVWVSVNFAILCMLTTSFIFCHCFECT